MVRVHNDGTAVGLANSDVPYGLVTRAGMKIRRGWMGTAVGLADSYEYWLLWGPWVVRVSAVVGIPIGADERQCRCGCG